MRLIVTLFVVLLASAPLLAESAVDVCAPDTARSSQQNITSNTYQQTTVLNAYITGNEIHVSDVQDGSILYIYSITGARVGSYTVRENKVVLNSNLSKGIYILRVNNRATKITVK